MTHAGDQPPPDEGRAPHTVSPVHEPGSRDAEFRTSLMLMRLALALLDRGGPTLAAARLQHAIDTAEGEQRTSASGAGRTEAGLDS